MINHDLAGHLNKLLSVALTASVANLRPPVGAAAPQRLEAISGQLVAQLAELADLAAAESGGTEAPAVNAWARAAGVVSSISRLAGQ